MPDQEHFLFSEGTINGHTSEETFACVSEGTYVIFQKHQLKFCTGTTFEQAAEQAVMQHVATSSRECVHSRRPLHFDMLESQPVQHDGEKELPS